MPRRASRGLCERALQALRPREKCYDSTNVHMYKCVYIYIYIYIYIHTYVYTHTLCKILVLVYGTLFHITLYHITYVHTLYMYMYVCMYICTYIHIYIYIYIYMCTRGRPWKTTPPACRSRSRSRPMI